MAKTSGRGRGPRPLIQQSGPSADQVEAASERDAAWFEAHPDQDMYVRARLPGEFGPFEGTPAVEGATHTQVTQLGTGLRAREPIVLLRRDAYPNQQIPAEHVEAFVAQMAGDVADLRLYWDSEIED